MKIWRKLSDQEEFELVVYMVIGTLLGAVFFGILGAIVLPLAAVVLTRFERLPRLPPPPP